MAHGRPRDPRKEQHWRHLIQQWQHSGLSVRTFCDRQHLSPPSFYAWRHRLQQRAAATAALVPVRVVADEPAPPAGPLEVILAGGRRLRVTPGFDPATLRQLLAVLEEAPPC
jgi:transposase